MMSMPAVTNSSETRTLDKIKTGGKIRERNFK